MTEKILNAIRQKMDEGEFRSIGELFQAAQAQTNIPIFSLVDEDLYKLIKDADPDDLEE